MLFIELHKRGVETPIQIFYDAVISYEPDENHCKISLYGGKASRWIEIEESYEEVKELFNKFEFVNTQHQLAEQVGIYQYLDLLNHEKENPLRDEYLRWKGMHELMSRKRYVDADELLEHIGRDALDRDKIHALVESLIIKNVDANQEKPHGDA